MEGEWPDLFTLSAHATLSFFPFSIFLPVRSNRSRYFCHSRKLLIFVNLPFVLFSYTSKHQESKNEDRARESGWCFSNVSFSSRRFVSYLWSKLDEGCWKNKLSIHLWETKRGISFKDCAKNSLSKKFENRSFTIRIESKLLEFTLKYKLCWSVIAWEKLNYPWKHRVNV